MSALGDPKYDQRYDATQAHKYQTLIRFTLPSGVLELYRAF